MALDPLPSILLRDCLDTLLPVITGIVGITVHKGARFLTSQKSKFQFKTILKKKNPNIFNFSSNGFFSYTVRV